MTTIYRQRPLQPWTHQTLRRPMPARTETIYVRPAQTPWDGVTTRTIFNPRAGSHLGSQLAPAVVLLRARDTDVTLPRAQNFEPIPLGSNGEIGFNDDALLPDTYGYETYGFGPYGGEPL